MPYKLLKSGNKYYVENIKTKYKYSKNPISKDKASRQKKILEAIEKNKNKKNNLLIKYSIMI